MGLKVDTVAAASTAPATPPAVSETHCAGACYHTRLYQRVVLVIPSQSVSITFRGCGWDVLDANLFPKALVAMLSD